MLSTIECLTVLGLACEFGSFMIFTWEFLKKWEDRYPPMSDQTKWKKQRRNAFIGVFLLLFGLIIQGSTIFL